MTNIQVKKELRISLKRILSILNKKNDEYYDSIMLKPSEARAFWITDADLYKAVLTIPQNAESYRRLAKMLETVMIVPAETVGEEKRPLSQDEIDNIMKGEQE